MANGYLFRYVAWDAEIVQQLVPATTGPMPTSLRFLQEVRFENEAGDGVDWHWGSGELFRPAVQAGREFLVLCGGCPTGTLRHGCRSGVYSINGTTHTLAERALEFPAGTPIATVMNSSTIEARLLNSVDGGVSAAPDAGSGSD